MKSSFQDLDSIESDTQPLNGINGIKSNVSLLQSAFRTAPDSLFVLDKNLPLLDNFFTTKLKGRVAGMSSAYIIVRSDDGSASIIIETDLGTRLK